MTADIERFFAAEWLLRLASQEDDLFQYPPLVVATLDKAIQRLVLAPEATFMGLIEANERPETWCFQYSRRSSNFNVYVNPIDTWLDVSESEPGSGGSAIYAAVGSFAHGASYLFIGDPAGLSDMALRRRTDAMLSSALKYGTTKHLAPHRRQLEGCAELGVPPLDWERGSTLKNLQAMIETSVASLESDVPEVCDAYYDFSQKAFCDAGGGFLLETVLGRWSDQLAGSGKTRAGLATLKRGILLRSLVRQESAARPELLEQVLRESSQFINDGSLAEIFY